MGYNRLCGVLVAQQKVVPNERLAGLVSGEGGRRVGFESHRIYSNSIEGTTMKTVYFENMRNRERFYCTNLKDVQRIDGVEYLRVFREGTQRDCLIKRELLKKITTPKK